jgi:N-dimethylarginine dimethylaminohydrolase
VRAFTSGDTIEAHFRAIEEVVLMLEERTRERPGGGGSAAQREAMPFRIVTADGETVELTYSSPRPAGDHDEQSLLETLPWFESGKPLRNYMLHEIDFYEEVEQIWGRPWGAEGIGTLREVLVSRPTENETRPEYAREWQYYYSSAAGTADLGKLQYQFDQYYEVLRANGVRVNYIEPPVPAIGAYGYLKNLVTLAGGGLVVRGGAIVHRMGLGSWQRGREVIWSKVLTALQVPIYLTIHRKGIGEPGAGRWLDSKTFVFNESVVANEEGLEQIRWILEGLGIEFVLTHSPGWYDSIGNGNIGTSHADMFMLVPDQGVCVLSPHLVSYAFIRYLKKRDVKIIEVPVEEYWDLAINGVTLAPGKIVVNQGSPTVLRALEQEGIEVIQVDFSESQKFAIAGLHCATLELVRDQPGPLLD